MPPGGSQQPNHPITPDSIFARALARTAINPGHPGTLLLADGPAGGTGRVRLTSNGGRNLPLCKLQGSSPHPGFDLFEPANDRRNSGHHEEKDVRLFRRTARFEEKSGRHDLNVRPPAPKAGALAKLSYAPNEWIMTD